jgi:formylglycine-generating enzyme required for sulfatase activity
MPLACKQRSAIGTEVAEVIASGTSGKRVVFGLPNGASLPMRWVAPGSFLMGSPVSEAGRVDDEIQHEVTLTDGFFIGETELTQEQWSALMPDNPSRNPGAQRPAETLSWDNCRRFCQELTRHQTSNGDLIDGWEWDLPTEAQWERACRAGASGPFGGTLDAVGWYFGNSDGTTHPVGQKGANSWGLRDMHGNVAEWCVDWFSTYSTNRNNWVDPVGPIWSFAPVVRGGSFKSTPNECRAAARSAGMPDAVPNNSLGFRPALKKKRS